MAGQEGVTSGMDVFTHPLFLALVPSLMTWGACRWRYRRQLRALEQALSAAQASHHDIRAGDGRAAGSVPARSVAGRALDLRLARLGGGSVLPFLDTSPLTHLEEPDLFGHLAEPEVPGAADRPYLN
jgi:hypothetical protein